MTIEEAFAILELPLEASRDDIARAFREKSMEMHPDTERGSHDAQVRLQNAHETAAAYARIKTSVVPVSGNAVAAELAKAVAGLPSIPDAEQAARRITRRRTRVLDLMKKVSWGVGGINALIVLMRENLTGGFSQEVSLVLTVSALAFGLTGLVLQLAVSSIQARIESFLEAIASRKGCASELAKALGYREVDVFSEDDLELPHIASAFPIPVPISVATQSEDIRTPLVARALEFRLINWENLQGEIQPDSIDRYRLCFEPVRFRPAVPPEPKPAPPMILREAVGMFVTGGAWLGLGVLATAYLGYAKSSYWAFATGFFTLPGLGLFMAALSELPGALKRRATGKTAKPPDE